MPFKGLRESPKGKVQRGQYLLAVDLGRYKWYQSQVSNDVPARTLGPDGRWIVMSLIGWGGEQNTIDKDCDVTHYRNYTKNTPTQRG